MRAIPYVVFLLLLVGLGVLVLQTSVSLFVVQTDSMSPMLRAGDAIVTRPFSGQVEVGDIVTYDYQGKVITHRVMGVLEEGLTTKGDANSEVDAWLVPLDSVQRVYWFRIPYLGYFVSYLHTRQGWFLAVILPAVLIVLNETRIIVRELLRRDRQERAAAG